MNQFEIAEQESEEQVSIKIPEKMRDKLASRAIEKGRRVFN
jgi:hypothetical protein